MFILTAMSAKAQFRYGAKAGYELSNLSISSPASSVKILLGNKSGFYAGGLVEYGFGNNFSIQAEVLYVNLGGKLTADVSKLPKTFNNEQLGEEFLTSVIDGKAVVTLHQLAIPIFAKYGFDKFSVNGGFDINVSLGVSASMEGIVEGKKRNLIEEIERENQLKINDEANKQLSSATFGLHIGAEYAFTDNFFAEVRYNWGLSSLNKNFTDFINLKQRHLQIGVGYKF
ncbi:porin family protein [Capnocytophaga sp.]|uniref:porin family protein n=1 Tax=Capnocytophaga sp. TaxID=44737 RepID=UPI0026DA8F34|nr:porin family protein [Capnocytophaga sp.]MDO5104551.1 porin family protein [Capnocytophaga sp.]